MIDRLLQICQMKMMMYIEIRVPIQQKVTIYALMMHNCMVCTKGYVLHVNQILRKRLFINLCDGVTTHGATDVS